MMDCGDTYVLMCRKATEIQTLAPTVQTHGEWYKCAICREDYGEDLSTYFSFCDHDSHIWLPRQDQLQAMVEGNFFEVFRRFVEWHVDMAGDARLQRYEKHAQSWEQLWLAYVMKLKFGKQWNGTDWVKEE